MNRKIITILLALLFSVGLVPVSSAIEELPSVDSLPLAEGVRLTSDGMKRAYIYGDYKGAKELLEQSIEADSLYAPAYYQLSLISDHLAIPADSTVKYAERAYQIDSTNIWYTDSYAQRLYMVGRAEEALKIYERKLSLNDRDPQAYIILAMIHMETKAPMAALEILNTAELKTGKNSYISELKRRILIGLNQTDKAIEESREMVEADPQNIEERIALAELYAANKQDSMTMVEYNAALEINSESEPLLNSMSQYYLKKENYPAYLNVQRLFFKSPSFPLEAKISLFERLTADREFYGRNFHMLNQLVSILWVTYPEDSKVVKLYADHLIASGELDKALEIYKEQTSKTPAEYDFFKSVIDIETFKQRADSVELYTNRAIELFPDHSELRLVRANSYAYAGKHDKALKAYETALEYIHEDSLRSNVWGYIGDSHHQMSLEVKPSVQRKNLKRAFKAYDKALELNPNNPLVLNNYAYFLSNDEKRLNEALDMSGRAVAITKRNSTYIDTYAWILYRLGRFEEAKEHMRQAIALDSTKSAELPFHYAEILAALGEKFMAEVYYKKALEAGYPEESINAKIEELKR